jgi:hypothetical protein
MYVIVGLLFLGLSFAHPAALAEGEAGDGGNADAEALAKAAQNPLSSLISLPFQHNLYFDTTRYDVDKRAVFRRWLLRRRISGGLGQVGNTPIDLGKRSRRFAGSVVEEHERNQYILNIQPVVPVNVGNWNLLNRPILPVIHQPLGKDDDEFGLGDLNYTLWFSPAEARKVT